MKAVSSCLSCQGSLYAPVAFCPFCGHALAAAPLSSSEPEPEPAVLTEPQADVLPPDAVPAAQAVPSHEPPPVAPPAYAPAAPMAAAPYAAAPPVGAPTVGTVKVRPPPAKRRIPWWWVAPAVVLLAWWAQGPSEREQACVTALDQVQARLAQGDVKSARDLLRQSHASCEGWQTGQERRSELAKALDQRLAEQVKCERPLRQLKTALADERLQRAQSIWTDLGEACRQLDPSLGAELRAARETVSTLETTLREHLAAGRAADAKEALARLVAAQRDHPALKDLQSQVQMALKVKELSQLDLPASSASVGVGTSPPSASKPGAASALELSQGLLRDAEAALAQQKFDAAKTFVASALRADPGNPQAQALLKRISAQELKYLREETSIR